MLDIKQELGNAVKHFWSVRETQQENQGAETGKKDAGNRSAVTGGKHADGFIRLIRDILLDAGIPSEEIFIESNLTLPGYFRPTKDWDVIVKVADDLIAVVEVKSQIGSFGNNFNNRAEEALGNAADFWTAYREATFKPSARPWLGYLMMLEEHPKSTSATRRKELKHYPMREEFQTVSYARRYEIFCERLVRERHYDAACFLMSSVHEGKSGKYTEPNAELAFVNFAASLHARAASFKHVTK